MSWVFRFRTVGGKAREMGLGSALDVALAEARNLADTARAQARKGIDPIEHRRMEKRRAATEAARALTFKQCAEAYIAAHASGWKNHKHQQQWSRTLETYAYPVFGDVPVSAVDVAMVTRVLDPIWKTKTETASRVRGRMESVLDWATVRGFRTGENPARWRGHLQKALPARSKVQRVQHHNALPYAQLPPLMRQLRGTPALSAKALELLILTATRTGEALGAEWSEIDLKAGVWTIPATRMKAGREHRIPLSRQAASVLKEVRFLGSPRWVFPGQRPDKPLSNMTMLKLLQGMGHTQITVHGFRSTFRDWAAEQTDYAREVAEAALAHTIGDKVEAAYRRGDLFEKRSRLMQLWANFVSTTGSDRLRVGRK